MRLQGEISYTEWPGTTPLDQPWIYVGEFLLFVRTFYFNRRLIYERFAVRFNRHYGRNLPALDHLLVIDAS